MAHFVIRLDNVRFRARIGVAAQERVAGNEFVVNLRVELDAAGFGSEDLATSLSYADIFEEVKTVMSQPHLLLETVSKEIADRLKNRWPQIAAGAVSVTKSVPPIAGFDGSATVEYIF